MFRKEPKEKWREGVFLCTCENSFQADLIESKLRSENIPCVKRYEGAGNYLEIFMGQNTTAPIDIYVAEDKLEDAKNVIVPVDLDDCEPME